MIESSRRTFWQRLPFILVGIGTGLVLCLPGLADTPFGENQTVTIPGQGVVISATSAPDITPIAAPVTAAPPKTSKYRVKAGDCLYALAARFLGDGNKYWEIIERNKDRYPSLLKNPDLILVDWELDIPGSGDAVRSSTENAAATTASINATPESPVQGTVQVSTHLNVRDGPWSTILGSLKGGDSVSIIGQEGDWYKISYGGKTAFVHANYVSTPTKGAGSTPVNYPDAHNTGASYQPAVDVTPGNGRFGAPPCTPMPSRLSSTYGWRDWNGDGKRDFHSGVDLPIGNGTRLNALGDGVVIDSGFEPGGGRYVKIRYDNGFESSYCHLQSVGVSPGQKVHMGQEVAKSDNTGAWTTGPHLHMTVRKNGETVDPEKIPGLPLP